jgi:glycosyltransferase involved in cell wall biosynthesis
MELISVIVTYFNKKKFIKQTFDSILAQSYKNFEVIFIYDQENLEEYNYIQNLVNSDSRFKFFNNKNNYGSSFSKNLGLSFATGEYHGQGSIERNVRFIAGGVYPHTRSRERQDTGSAGDHAGVQAREHERASRRVS